LFVSLASHSAQVLHPHQRRRLKVSLDVEHTDLTCLALHPDLPVWPVHRMTLSYDYTINDGACRL
jgi:hypothetical protein